MFHVTNFTESSESHMPLDKLMLTSMTLWERLPDIGIDPKNVTVEQLSEVATILARAVYEEKFRKPLGPIDTLEAEEQAVVMLNAVCSNWFGLWGLNAFPRIQLSHSFAAMLMATTISPKELPHVEAPWPAFLIEVPEGLLPLRTTDDKESFITRIHVVSHLLPTAFKERWWGFWESGKAVEVVRAGPLAEATILSSPEKLSQMKTRDLSGRFERIEERDLPIDDFEEFWEGYDREQADRVASLVGRLVIGACTLMTERANYTEKVVRFEMQNAMHARRIGKQPESRVYTLGKPIQLDFRPALREYINGTRPGKSLTVQRLVAGHHKWQPHGPQNTLRKWIFIKPYWQGPQEAPIVVRPHVGDKTE